MNENTFTPITKAVINLLSLFIIEQIVLVITKSIVNNDSLTYLIGYILLLIPLILINKNKIKENFKDFKKIKRKTLINIIIVTLLTFILVFITNIILTTTFHVQAENETILESTLKNNPLTFSISIIILAPIIEEFIFRFPFNNVKNKKASFLIYTLIFALLHMVSFNYPQILFLIPYTLLSITFGYAFYKTDNILLSIIIHIINNLINVMIILL